MAGYNNQQRGGYNNTKPSYAGNSVGPKKTDAEKGILYSTGLFKPEKGMAVGTVKVKETITIPAGSYINLYQNEAKNEKSPAFRVQIRQSVAKK